MDVALRCDAARRRELPVPHRHGRDTADHGDMSPFRVRLTALALLLATPLASGWLAGLPEGFGELPPRTVSIEPPGFSAPMYAVLGVMLIGVAVFLAAPALFGFEKADRGKAHWAAFTWALPARPGGRFPGHGWTGLALVAAGWAAAWTHPDWLGALADHTFFPLWLGYILTVDGLVHRRAGTSPLSRSMPAWLAWFPASAAAWWYFELLNRFVQNWIYLGVEHFSAPRYVAGATLAFSTVIPAVLTTAALLSTFGWFRGRFVRAGLRREPGPPSRAVWWPVAAAGVLGLVLVPWLPTVLFPLIWIAPLLVIAGLLEPAGKHTGLGHMLRGDWGPVVILAVAALVCGFFWELWNIHATPKWTYRIPWMDGAKLFEMPLVGYLGYLPFGPACWAFWLLLSPDRVSRPATGHDPS